ncbi:SlyX family protein [Rheinheimera sp. UJ63]|uniref:SlyX family protein n=1 Tax=Rheinheimera sp. UJ63 TaxID=2910157 RepID=UPI001F315A1B|nr:SlyX family protein [Rheinheimera sp. UJ63]MCF4010683.1 SlyX family protein [Rheinheimera sp. UJ63]
MSNEPIDIQLHLIELESKIAFQEDTVNCLHEELLAHQKRIDQLQRQILTLAEKLQQLPQDSEILRPEEEPPPPHY